ncbi:MAG: DNA recombination protein RmuC, partial [Oricola sp.]|nr:DNA recombination protein RmuC [Oricola sp.]
RPEAKPDFDEAEPDDEAFHVNDADDDLGFFAPEPEGETAREPEPKPAAAQHAPAEDRRVAEAEAKAKDALRRAEEAEAFARDLERANAEAKRAMSLEVQKREAALEERAKAMAAMEQRLAAMSDDFQERIEAASAAADEKMTEAPESLAAYHDAPPIVSEEHFAEFANLMGEQFDVLRGEVNSAVEKLSKRLDNLPTAPGAATATAARVQLTDLLGDALAPQRYKLNFKLPTGRTAEAAIVMPGPMAPVAIDARFPVEAFDAWQLSRNAGTETELRRAVLRNIADAGEKLIVAEETADCAMMFIPSENILSELHAHFSDLVQESYRARVFMVSPTSLMATL